MGKGKKKRSNKSSDRGKPASETAAVKGDEPRLSLAEIQTLEKAESELEKGLAPFQRGDFVRARALFQAAAEDEKLSDDARERARELVQAIRPERTALLAGLGAGALLFLIMLVAGFTQPGLVP